MASSSWKRLHGIFCVYKPPLKKLNLVAATLKTNLINDLNSEYKPVREKLIKIEGDVGSPLKVIEEEKLSVHPLAIGPAFSWEDIKVSFANKLGFYTSGVMVVGIGKAANYAEFVPHCRLIRTYRLSGVLGKATYDFHISSKVIEKSRFLHVTSNHLEKILMMIQSVHQKRAMETSGLHLQSQEAFETLAEEGIVRPSRNSYFLLYALKCIEFKPPYFTIEVSCINETEDNLRKLIHEIGLLLKTNATTSKVQCIRYGCFNVDDALLVKHWRLPEICDNIESLLERAKYLHPKKAGLQWSSRLESRGGNV